MANLLSNDKITLRAMEPSDIDLIYKWENDTSLWTVSDTVAPYSREALMLYIANCANDIYANKQLRLMVTLTATGETVGTVDFLNFNPIHNRAELGVYICKEHQGQGLSAETMKIVNAYAAQGIGLRQLYVYVPVPPATRDMTDGVWSKRQSATGTMIVHCRSPPDIRLSNAPTSDPAP